MISELFPPYVLGGGERRYYEIAKRLAKRHEVHVYTMHIAGSPREEVLDGICVHRLGVTHPLNRRAYPQLLVYFFCLIKELGKKRFDVIDCNAYISAFGGFLIAKIGKIPCVVTIHDVYAEKWGYFLNNRLLGIAGRLVEAVLVKLPFDRIITVSGASAELLEGLYRVENIKVINNGVDDVFFRDFKAKRKKKILFVGRLVPLKNLTDLLKAFGIVSKKYPGLKLEIVGQGPLENELKKLCGKLEIEKKVAFLGSVSTEDIAKKMHESLALVNPSLREGFGLVLLEAMACGTPVIAYRLKAYGDFAGKNNSILIHRGDYSGLADAVEAVFNKKYWNRLSREGRRTAKNFRWDLKIVELEKIYNEI